MLRAEGVNVNRKRVQRLMRLMGIAALGPKREPANPCPATRQTPAHPEDLLPRHDDRGGALNHVGRPTSPTFRSGAVFSISRRSSTGRRARWSAWLLSNTIYVSFVLAALERRSASSADRKIFVHDQGPPSSPRPPSPARSSKPASRSPWTAALLAWTTCSLNGGGGRSEEKSARLIEVTTHGGVHRRVGRLYRRTRDRSPASHCTQPPSWRGGGRRCGCGQHRPQLVPGRCPHAHSKKQTQSRCVMDLRLGFSQQTASSLCGSCVHSLSSVDRPQLDVDDSVNLDWPPPLRE